MLEVVNVGGHFIIMHSKTRANGAGFVVFAVLLYGSRADSDTICALSTMKC